MNTRATRIAGFVGFGALVALVVVLPAFVSDYNTQRFAYVGVYLIALLGLNVLTGYTGQISLGHGAFMAIGGYTSALLMVGNEQFGGPIGGGVRDVWTIPVAGLVAGLIGFAFGIPALRLSGLYLALATFAIAVATPPCSSASSSSPAAARESSSSGSPRRPGRSRGRSRSSATRSPTTSGSTTSPGRSRSSRSSVPG